jgi:hypothetical protein
MRRDIDSVVDLRVGADAIEIAFDGGRLVELVPVFQVEMCREVQPQPYF